jgi:hypothetical protein
MVFAEAVMLSAAVANPIVPDVAGFLSAVSDLEVDLTAVVGRIRAASGHWHEVYVNQRIQEAAANTLNLKSAIRSDSSAEQPTACSYGDVVILGAQRTSPDDYLPIPNATIAVHEIYQLFLPAGHRHIGFSHAGLMS